MFSFMDMLKFKLFETIYARPVQARSPDCDGDATPEETSSEPYKRPRRAHGYIRHEQHSTLARRRGRCKHRDLGASVTGGGAPKPCMMTLPAGANFPGLLRHVCHNSRCVMPLCFEGLLLNVRQGFSSNWTVEHTMAFSQICPAGYRLLVAYSGDAADLRMPYALVEVSPAGYVTVEGRAAPTRSTRAAVMGQFAKGDVANWECTFDAYFDRSTASVLTVNREMIALHYFHAITSSIALGVEGVAWGERSAAAGALQWRSEAAACGVGGDYASLFLGTRGLDLCYAHLAFPYLTVAAKVEVGFMRPRCLAALAYEFRGGGGADDRYGGRTGKGSVWTARGSIDTDGLVGGTLERALGSGQQAALSVAVSALYNLTHDKFGLGLRCTATLL